MNTLNWICNRFNVSATTRQVNLPISRAELAALFAELGFKRGAEIGVERGLYAEELCKAIPKLELYAVDAWEAYAGYREHVSQEKLDDLWAEAIQRLTPYGVNVWKMFSRDAAQCFNERELDFVYLDGNHAFFHLTQDLQLWSEKVKARGIVAGHDFIRRKGAGYVNHTKDVLPAWVNAYGIRPLFICRGDRNPSWFWVKS